MEYVEQDIDVLGRIATALEQFHNGLKTRKYVGGANPLAEVVMQTAPITSLEDYSPDAFSCALEATENRWKEIIDAFIRMIKQLIASAIKWFSELFRGTADKAHDRLDAAIEQVAEVDEAVASNEELRKEVDQSAPEDETTLGKQERFKATFANGIGSCIVKLNFKEDHWISLISAHIKLCVHITREITHSDDILTAIQEQRKSLKGQIARDIDKANAARNAFEKALGLEQTRAKTFIECVQANTRLMTVIQQTDQIRVNPDHLLTNIPTIAKLMSNMDSATYREVATRDIAASTERLESIEAGIERVEKQLATDEAIARQEESQQLREWVKELHIAIGGLNAASRFHILYVNGHARIVESFTQYYAAAAKEKASKLSANALVEFNKALKKENKS